METSRVLRTAGEETGADMSPNMSRGCDVSASGGDEATVKVARSLHAITVTPVCAVQFLVEGVLMAAVAGLGILTNLASFLFFLHQKYHKTFHRLFNFIKIRKTCKNMNQSVLYSLNEHCCIVSQTTNC